MNKQRRAELIELTEDLEEIASRLECIQDDEQEAYDNLPESLQCSSKGEKIESYVDMIQDSIDEIRQCASSIMEIVEIK